MDHPDQVTRHTLDHHDLVDRADHIRVPTPVQAAPIQDQVVPTHDHQGHHTRVDHALDQDQKTPEDLRIQGDLKTLDDDPGQRTKRAMVGAPVMTGKDAVRMI